jgi:hypothetical protein
MEGTSYWGTTNLKVASCVAAFGGTLRQNDPVTHIILENGTRQVTFWFNGGTGSEEKKQMECKWSDMTCDVESPIRYVRAALENRETLLGLVKTKAEPIQIIKRGGQTLLVPLNAKPELKKAILKAI